MYENSIDRCDQRRIHSAEYDTEIWVLGLNQIPERIALYLQNIPNPALRIALICRIPEHVIPGRAAGVVEDPGTSC